TCIAHSLEENTNLLSHLTLEPTKKCQIIKLNAGSKEYNIWDFGGQERHLDSHLDDEKTFLGANKLIYVIDIQDEDSHEPALEYLKKIVEKIRKGGLEIQVSVFLHKFDPELELDGKLATIGDGLKKKIAAIIPSEMGYKIFKTTIYTMFQQNRFYPL
ncbi:MAG: ADP-ribosylation factor-like protein, partial [Candidatus Hodarchaeota archaeon]